MNHVWYPGIGLQVKIILSYLQWRRFLPILIDNSCFMDSIFHVTRNGLMISPVYRQCHINVLLFGQWCQFEELLMIFQTENMESLYVFGNYLFTILTVLIDFFAYFLTWPKHKSTSNSSEWSTLPTTPVQIWSWTWIWMSWWMSSINDLNLIALSHGGIIVAQANNTIV